MGALKRVDCLRAQWTSKFRDPKEDRCAGCAQPLLWTKLPPRLKKSVPLKQKDEKEERMSD